MNNILDYLETSTERLPDKPIFSDENNSVSYSAFTRLSKAAGSLISSYVDAGQAVAIYMPKSISSLISCMGVVYGGCFYCMIDYEMPESRITRILDTLTPKAVIYEGKALPDCFSSIDIKINSERFSGFAINETELSHRRAAATDTDPVYVLFTSGSTGSPKGVVINHRNIISYTKWVEDAFKINSQTVFGNQTPFYFSMSVLDIYTTIRCGAEMCIIPKKLFAFPLKLIEYINEHKINTIYWVPSALCIVANLKTFDYITPPKLKLIMFAGEVMPTKQLNYWIKSLPDSEFANLYGPTETTDICAYWRAGRNLRDDEPVPIGNACENCGLIIIDSDGNPADEGELYVRGSIVAAGYYNNPETTAKAFVQNPLNKRYPETVYKTGDLVRKNEYGELVFVSRCDFQIKHMGYRIELGEIETAANSLDAVTYGVCLYNPDTDKIILVYTGRKSEPSELRRALSQKLPAYMLPSEYVFMRRLPHNQNGKVDRKELLSAIK